MRPLSIAAPLFLLAYGILRWIDGLDGHRKDGLAWDVGHVSFLVAMVLFGALAVLLAGRAVTGRRLARVAAAGAVAGVGCFVWVILGDLSEEFARRWPLPDALQVAGPLAFVLGMVVLLGLQVAAGRAPVWSPVLLFAGYAAISVNLDLLPVASLLILASTAPLARSAAWSPRTVPAVSRLRRG
ncbi:hypothetical protein [Paractinoplanes rishiriensis]|uniref:Uncharacterized protein n=1 Tax=Paractinoplanes rishiriensis TaxID=1050105 RepID=A0A919K0F7_9ACTN|nr:hypothetical protein [Actinoplanes rishiriensis]GIE97109.1 hypothetical protein Ari01nite_45740 [Actinoplanes rishiriensis]